MGKTYGKTRALGLETVCNDKGKNCVKLQALMKTIYCPVQDASGTQYVGKKQFKEYAGRRPPMNSCVCPGYVLERQAGEFASFMPRKTGAVDPAEFDEIFEAPKHGK